MADLDSPCNKVCAVDPISALCIGRGRTLAEIAGWIGFRADERTREPYVAYLARYFAGQARERLKQLPEAERAYRGALAATPRAQSASFALSALLGSHGRRTEAAALIDAALTANPIAFDPWRAYGEADARFWPVLIAQLHEEIAK